MYAAADRLTVLPPTLELRVLPRVESATEPASLVLGDDSAVAGRRARTRCAPQRARQLGEELDGAEMVDAAARERYY